MTTTTLPLQAKKYREDIDGLRAIAVLSVIFFHLGYLPNGHLGVDIFFGISGYLITKILYAEMMENRFSIIHFYLRRARRIVPLVLCSTYITLLIGLFVMLPDDLENLSQSVFATNIFTNNILLLITTGNYWVVINQYKPLMHTWSLGIEEQFYLVYPIIFLLLKKRTYLILPALFVLTSISLFLFLSSSNESVKFYTIPYRFFELSLGGIAGIMPKYKFNSRWAAAISLLTILITLLFNLPLSNDSKLIIIVASTISLLVAGGNNSLWLLENRFLAGIGKISFSLYLWHHIVLAYMRYVVTDNLGLFESLHVLLIIALLSALSFYLIEQPFRNKEKIPIRPFLLTISVGFTIICGVSLYLHSIGGVIRDVPELELYKSHSGNLKSKIHTEYNMSVYDLNKGFANNNKKKILVIGNSFARDFVNILLESQFKNHIEVSYAPSIICCKDMPQRLHSADFIFFSELKIKNLSILKHKYHVDTAKVWNVGPKNFGSNNGLFYNRRTQADYCMQRTNVQLESVEINNYLKKRWVNKYIDLMSMIMDENGQVPIFTPGCKFISQDGKHLTRAGAIYFAQLLDTNKIICIE